MTEMWQIRQYYRQCICMGKKIKKKKNTTLEIMSFCHFGLEVLILLTLG